MIHQKLFAETVANWLTQTILASISERAVFMRASVETASELIRLRPDILRTVTEMYAPAVKILGVFRDGMVDSEVVRVGLSKFFASVKSIDLKESLKDYIPNFSYNLTTQEIDSLCRALASAEGASQLLDKEKPTNV
jgi:hypothetical protein